MKQYQWDLVTEEAMPSLTGDVLRRFVGGEQMTVARVTFSGGAEIAAHRHENEQFSLILSGTMEFLIEDVPILAKTGDIIHLPANELHGAKALEPSVVLDVFSPPRTDWGQPWE